MSSDNFFFGSVILPNVMWYHIEVLLGRQPGLGIMKNEVSIVKAETWRGRLIHRMLISKVGCCNNMQGKGAKILVCLGS